MSFIQMMKFEGLAEAGYRCDWKLDEQTIIGYIRQCVAWMSLTWLQEPDGSFDDVKYWAKKVLLWNALPEDFPAETTISFDGANILKVFYTRVEADEDEVEFAQAKKAAWTVMTQSVMREIIHGKELTYTPHCGTLLDLPDNEGKNVAPGTFGELLRYGSVHLEQTREMQYIEAAVADSDLIIRKGLVEA
ncbi:hypothetical protein G6011_06692 [Alternaria panax]|uniref:Uncharacterized protein n=1 Tax=Alternaria panax TaxID=48097 RepID=A0AAD4I9V4_9PLEO|nr:hypothetical protein G6011_06692 [Alternaria panax]